MPKYAHHSIEGGGVVIWHITESSEELYSLLATRRYDKQLLDKKNEVRRAEWLAVRLIVKELFGADCEVAYHSTGRPYLKNSDVHISISHTKGYAAVAYHHVAPIGVDIEYVSSRVERIADRFSSQEESSYIELYDAADRQKYHLINWSAKESLYKLFDSSSMADFKAAFNITHYLLGEKGELSALVRGVGHVKVCYSMHAEFVCTCTLDNSTIGEAVS